VNGNESASVNESVNESVNDWVNGSVEVNGSAVQALVVSVSVNASDPIFTTIS